MPTLTWDGINYDPPVGPGGADELDQWFSRFAEAQTGRRVEESFDTLTVGTLTTTAGNLAGGSNGTGSALVVGDGLVTPTNAARFVSTASSTWQRYLNIGQTNFVWVSVSVVANVAPTSTICNLITARTLNSATVLAGFGVNSSGQFVLRNGGTTVATAATVMRPGFLYQLILNITPTALTGYIYDNAGRLMETLTGTYSGGTFDAVAFGLVTNGWGPAASELTFDRFIADTRDPILPVQAPGALAQWTLNAPNEGISPNSLFPSFDPWLNYPNRDTTVPTPVSAADTGTGTDTATVAVAVTGTDTGTGTDTATLAAALSAADTAAGTDTATLAAALTGADTGAGTDTATLAAALTGSDTATGTDTASLAVARSAADTAAGTDTASLAAALTGSDTSTGTDAASLAAALTGTDTGAGSDAATLAVARSASDTATGTDVASVASGPSVADTAIATDTAFVTVTQTAADTATATDTAVPSVAVTAADVATAVDVAYLELLAVAWVWMNTPAVEGGRLDRSKPTYAPINRVLKRVPGSTFADTVLITYAASPKVKYHHSPTAAKIAAADVALEGPGPHRVNAATRAALIQAGHPDTEFDPVF